MESDHLQSLICSIRYWLANTNFPTKQKTFLSSSSTETYFKNVKEVFKKKFGHSHLLFTNEPQDAWFAALKLCFDSECARHAMLDLEVSVDRTSEPLYRDVTADASIIQAKYQGKVNLDVLSICKSMIKKGNESSVKELAELVLSRQGTGRGGNMDFFAGIRGHGILCSKPLISIRQS